MGLLALNWKGCTPRLLAPLGLAWALCADAVEPLHLWNALPRGPVTEALEQYYSKWLSHELRQPVVLHAIKPGVRLPVVPESQQSNTLLLIPALGLRSIELVSEPLEKLPIVPLQVIMHSSWCLMLPGATAPASYAQLHRWLEGLGHSVRLAVPAEGGMPLLWMRAMAVKTALPWVAVQQAASGDPVHSLQDGRADLLLTRCGDRRFPPSAAGAMPVSVVAMSATSRGLAAPLFADWQLPPLTQGWLGAFAPTGMKAARQEQLAFAVYAVNQRKETVALMDKWQRSRSNLTPQASRDYVFNLRRSEQVLETWLLQAGSQAGPAASTAPRASPAPIR